MHSAGTANRLNISNVGPRFGSTKLTTSVIRGALTLAVLSALVLMAAHPAEASSETVLYNFLGGSDGAAPQSRLLADGAGNFYGTTYIGGAFNVGTVFELSPNGVGGWNEAVLYSFTGGADGGNPYCYLIFDGAGNLYGTASGGGANSFGVVFELSPAGASWTETVLYSFGGYSGDGTNPRNGLIMDSNDNLFGTTYFGGNLGDGTVFELSPSGGGWTEQTIYSGNTYAGVTMDAAGNIFGAEALNVFELTPNGSGGWNSTIIHNFAGGKKDGTFAYATPVVDKAGNIYGTTLIGGTKNAGVVYRLSPGKKGYKQKLLYSFKGGKDGANPYADIMFDAAGNIYSTTGAGSKSGAGTVFELVAPVGTGSYKEKVLWSFTGLDGGAPLGSVILDSAGNLYGTTSSGGSSSVGVVFEVKP